tara:strand:+ start:654 stop:965 length:312 start_codon:yes stop_codon:yes gene_type:complete
MYKPLPKEVTVKESAIQGLGLFAVEDIKKGHEFGVSHVLDFGFENSYIRTPLGGFINHSEDANCELAPSVNKQYRTLVSIKHITKGTEITTKYSLYELVIGKE